MSQYSFGNLTSPLSGTAFIDTHLEPWRDAVHSLHSGTTRPTYAVAGTEWLDTTTTPWVLKMFDGTDDISLGTINATTNVYAPPSVGVSVLLINDFRLTLTSNTPVTTSDVTGASTLYLTPYIGNRIALYSGGAWAVYSSAQVSFNLTGLTANTLYDVFAFNNAGTVTLEILAWSNSGAGTSARATALAYQDGVYVRSGDATRRYLGTFRTTGTTTTEDSVGKRFLYNYYNRARKRFFGSESTASWTYSTAAWRQWNNATNAEFSFVQGVAEDIVSYSVIGLVNNSTATPRSALVGIGVNSSTSVAASGAMIFRSGAISALPTSCMSQGSNALFGFNTIKALEQGAGIETQTFYGSSSFDVGIFGEGNF